jgi:hypothetical protein
MAAATTPADIAVWLGDAGPVPTQEGVSVMTPRTLALAGAVLLASVGTAAAQSTPPAAPVAHDQVATGAPRQPAPRSTWFISPNDPRYQENGAPRRGEETDRDAPYAPIHGDA